VDIFSFTRTSFDYIIHYVPVHHQRMRLRFMRHTLFQTYPPRHIDLPIKERIRAHYDAIAPRRHIFRSRHRYYHRSLERYFKFFIPVHSTILDVGCGDGWLLHVLNPDRGVGIDCSPSMIEIARARYGSGLQNLEFHTADIECIHFNETFDVIIMSDVINNLVDIQTALDNIRSACTEQTRIIINYHSILWEPLLKAGERLSIKMPQPHSNWLSSSDIRAFLTLSDFELVRYERKLLAPIYIPVLSAILNKWIAALPLFNRLALSHFLIARCRPAAAKKQYSVSIVIPCLDEKENIRPAVSRLPRFGSSQEVIFVDGGSTDGTREEIRTVAAENPAVTIQSLVQPGTGKGDAVRWGFTNATGDILMILDADLTVPPEDLSRFYTALAAGKADFINGSRLVYPMEKQAMRFLNILGNAFFSWIFSWILNQKIKDTLCGAKALFKKDYEGIARQRSYFGDFDPFGDFDLLFGAAKLNLKILEVPIRYRERTYGVTHIHRIRHGLLLLRMSLIALRKFKG